MKKIIVKTILIVFGASLLLAFGAAVVGGQDHTSVVAAELKALGGPAAVRGETNADRLGLLMRNIAVRLGPPYGVLIKTSGNNCAGLSCDIICTGNGSEQDQYDVLEDAGGRSVPRWDKLDRETIVVRECVVPSQPVPVPTPTPPPSDEVIGLLRALQAQQGALLAAVQGISCGGSAVSPEQYAEITRLLSAPRPVELKGNWMVGTIKGTINGPSN